MVCPLTCPPSFSQLLCNHSKMAWLHGKTELDLQEIGVRWHHPAQTAGMELGGD